MTVNRRMFLNRTLAGLTAMSLPGRAFSSRGDESSGGADQRKKKAQIAVTLDLEMSRNFPRWEDTRWDFEKGNLDHATKEYTVEAARRIAAYGGRIHCFALGQTMEQENVDWLKGLIDQGHAVGNHTYDHVNVTASSPDQIQFRFQRSPWLIGGKNPQEVIVDNITLAEAALKHRLGIRPNGFRTPGGFAQGLRDRPDLQKLFLDLGYPWISSLYPPHPTGTPKERPTREIIDEIVRAQEQAQPFVYPNGLIEIPMSPISDIGAFRTGRWPVEGFVDAVTAAINWAIEHGGVFDFLAHPSCLVASDPDFTVFERIGQLVRDNSARAELVTLDKIAESTRLQSGGNVR